MVEAAWLLALIATPALAASIMLFAVIHIAEATDLRPMPRKPKTVMAVLFAVAVFLYLDSIILGVWGLL